MTDLRTSQNIAPMVGLREAFAQIGRAVTRGLEAEARRKASRRRRRDLDRPRAVVQKAAHPLSLKLPSSDCRNLIGRTGRQNIGGWDVWILESATPSTSLTGSFIGSYDEWTTAITVAQSLTRDGGVLSPDCHAPNLPSDAALHEDSQRGVWAEAGEYSSWGEVPC